MRRRRLFVGLIGPAALLLLVGALATLQYHWVGQVSEADREQLRDSLDRRVAEFTADFDREITHDYQGLQPAPGTFDPGAPEAFAAKYEQWKSAARFPEIVRSIYFARQTTTGLDLYRFDPSLRTFESADWPASLASVKSRLSGVIERVGGTGSEGPRVFSYSTSSIVPDVPAIVIPVADPLHPSEPPVNPPRGSGGPSTSLGAGMRDFFVALRVSQNSLIVELDHQAIREHMLPAIAARHFPESGSDRYRVSILDPKSDPVLSRGLREGERIAPDQADVAASFFSLRLDALRDTAVRWTTTARGGTVTGTASRSAPGTVVVKPGVAQDFSMLVEQRATTATAATPIMRLSTANWKVLVQHAAGSLDEAVAQARRRNLLLSFGILGILMASVALIVVNARRSERLAAQQMDFVATVSHELRTPLAVIRSAAQNLSAGVVHDGRQAQRYGDLIEAEGRRLTDMVEQVLEYAGLSGNRRPVMARPIDLGGVVHDVVSTSAALFEAEGVTVEVDVPADLPPVVADEGAIRRALHNLVTNALKYAADGRWVGISARVTTSRGEPEVQIAVSDRGRGIAAEDLAHIFEPFYRGKHAIDRQIHGNGLGLSLVRRIAEAHGGRITVASSAGAGSTFTLHVPAVPAQSAASGLPTATPEAAGPSA